MARPMTCMLAGVLWLLAIPAGPTAAATAAAAESATKAAMIYNFSRFTAWPDDRFNGPTDPVVLCVDPDAALAGPLGDVSGKPVGGRLLVVRQTRRIDHSCQMAYVDARDASDGYLSGLRDHGVLTIGENPGFTRIGAIQLVTIGRQIRFAINQQNALDAGARLSSNLLRLAVAVH